MLTFENTLHNTSTTRFLEIGDSIGAGPLRVLELELCGLACNCPIEPVQNGFEIVSNGDTAVICKPGELLFSGYKPGRNTAKRFAGPADVR